VQRYVPATPRGIGTLTTRQLMGDGGGGDRIRGDNPEGVSVESPDGPT
jgi:hypothetical protein